MKMAGFILNHKAQVCSIYNKFIVSYSVCLALVILIHYIRVYFIVTRSMLSFLLSEAFN